MTWIESRPMFFPNTTYFWSLGVTDIAIFEHQLNLSLWSQHPCFVPYKFPKPLFTSMVHSTSRAAPGTKSTRHSLLAELITKRNMLPGKREKISLIGDGLGQQVQVLCKYSYARVNHEFIEFLSEFSSFFLAGYRAVKNNWANITHLLQSVRVQESFAMTV